MLTNRFSNIFIVSLVLAAALITVSFAVSSAPSASAPTVSRLYDEIEQMRLERSFSRPQADTSYDQIEELRVGSVPVTAYDQIETLRAGRTLGSFAVGHDYDAIEQIRADRLIAILHTDGSYDALENLRILRTNQ